MLQKEIRVILEESARQAGKLAYEKMLYMEEYQKRFLRRLLRAKVGAMEELRYTYTLEEEDWGPRGVYHKVWHEFEPRFNSQKLSTYQEVEILNEETGELEIKRPEPQYLGAARAYLYQYQWRAEEFLDNLRARKTEQALKMGEFTEKDMKENTQKYQEWNNYISPIIHEIYEADMLCESPY